MSKNSLHSGISLVAVHKVNIQSHPDIPPLFVYRSLWRDIEVLCYIQCVTLAAEPGISLIILPLLRILQRLQTHSHTTNLLLFKFRCNIFIGVRIIKEMQVSVAIGTRCVISVHRRLGALGEGGASSGAWFYVNSRVEKARIWN